MEEKENRSIAEKNKAIRSSFFNFFRRLFVFTGKLIGDVIDKFYPPFKKYISLQFFRYSASGIINTGFDWVLYFVVYNFVIQKKLVHLGFVALSPHVASLLITFPITLFTGFLLQKYVTFTASNMRGKHQLYRYILVVIVNLLVNYIGLKLLVDILSIYPTPSKMLITIVTVTISYFSQKKFTFRISNETNR